MRPEQGWPWVAALLSAAPRIRKEFAALRAAAEATAQPGTKGGKWSGLYLINQVRIALAPNYPHVMRPSLTMVSIHATANNESLRLLFCLRPVLPQTCSERV